MPFNFIGDLYCVKDYSCIHMPIQMPMPSSSVFIVDFEN